MARYEPLASELFYEYFKRDRVRFVERTRFTPDVFERVIAPAVLPVIRSRSRHTDFYKPCQLEDTMRLCRYLNVMAEGKYSMPKELFKQSKTTIQRDTLFLSKCVTTGLAHFMRPIELGSREYHRLKGTNHLSFHRDALYIGDVTPIYIKRPVKDQHIYYNGHRKKHCFNVLSIMDSKGRFRAVYGPYVGSIHDNRIWINSDFCLNIENYLGQDDLIVYDKGLAHTHSHRDKILLPLSTFTGRPLATPAMKRFDKRIRKCRVLVENGFGRLKGLWKIADPYTMSNKQEVVSAHLHACFILTNIHMMYMGSYGLRAGLARDD